MSWKKLFHLSLMAAIGISYSASFQIGFADDWYKPLKAVVKPLNALHREKPVTGKDDSIEHLAREIDWLEHHIDKYGSIVAKHPDIWGQSRLMRHRYEYEKQMAAQIEHFEVRMNGALRRSDQAFLGMAFALQAASGSRTTNGNPTPTPIPTVSQATTDLQIVNGLIPNPNTPVTGGEAAIIKRTEPFSSTATTPLPGFSFSQNQLSLEPATQLDQMSRYLNHLHELRRINEGDDIADSPGYSLNLVRIPVSVLPGKQTQKGYGAEITITAEPYISDELLPTTIRNMVINDAVDFLAPVLTAVVNDENIRRTFGKGNPRAQVSIYLESSADSSQPAAIQKSEDLKRLTLEAMETALNVHTMSDTTSLYAPSAKMRRARMPLPGSQVPSVIGSEQLSTIAYEIFLRFQSIPTSMPTIEYVDVRAYLHEELEAAYDFLSSENLQSLWTFCDHNLAVGVRERRIRSIQNVRATFFNAMGRDDGNGIPTSTMSEDMTSASSPKTTLVSSRQSASDNKPSVTEIRDTTTAALAWAVIVESSLLNERLTEDMREAAISKGCQCVPDQCGPFIGPSPSPEARQAFNAYVRCRWPVRVFALDPVTNDQNIADAYARRREMQVAVALAFASGQINAQSMLRYTRRLEWDMATININHTSVGFSHGNDTFGWRFHPRFQSPPVKGTIATFGETLFGGPTSDSDMRSRQLESGMRECTAIVVMPSFVPYMTFDIRTNWFKLTNPKCTEVSMEETMKLSRSIQAMKQSAAACAPCAHLYRDGEVHRLLKRVDQLDQELPLQTMQAQIPYENTSGGFELFNTGITDLAPELTGWYGSPGINPNATTTLYLIGKGFSVHSTQLIAGGRNVPFNLISRQVMSVEIPTGVQVLKKSQDAESDTRFDEVVDIHLATPYGVSSHLLVPVAKAGASLQSSGGQLSWRTGALLNMFATVPKPTSGDPVANISTFFKSSSPALLIDVPPTSPLPSTLTLVFEVRAADGTFLGALPLTTAAFDPRENTIFISADALKNLVGTDAGGLGGKIKPYLEWQLNKNSTKLPTMTLSVIASLDPGNSRPLIPIAQGFQVQVDTTYK